MFLGTSILLSQIRLSSVCLKRSCAIGSGVETFGNVSTLLCTSSDLRAKFYGDRPRGTPPRVNARGVAKQSVGGPVEGYIS